MMRYKPMLAYPVNDKPIDYNKPVFIQPKLDGVRCLIQYNTSKVRKKKEVVAYSRTGKRWLNINHILVDLKPFFEKNPHIVLDGESDMGLQERLEAGDATDFLDLTNQELIDIMLNDPDPNERELADGALQERANEQR